MNPAPKFVFPGHNKEKVGKEHPPRCVDYGSLEKLLSTALDKDRGNTSGAIVERFIKLRASTILGHPAYSLDGPGLSISVSVPHEEFSTVLLGYEWAEKCRWMIYTNQDSQSMDVSRNKAACSETALKPVSSDSYETGKSGAWKT